MGVPIEIVIQSVCSLRGTNYDRDLVKNSVFLGKFPACFEFIRGSHHYGIVASDFLQGVIIVLTAHHLHISYNLNTILEDVSFSVNAGERVGLIGPNGCGKTTLMRILAGKEKPDKGHVSLSPGNLRVGFLSQGLKVDPELSIEGVLQSAQGDPDLYEAEVARMADALVDDPQNTGLQLAYDRALNRLQETLSADIGNKKSILDSLGLSPLDQTQPVNQLSGGQKTRLSLALVLLQDPQLLLLDEPTNHLDIKMLEWLERWLRDYPGGALIVSHDRVFLDQTVDRILDLDPETHKIRSCQGNYSTYLGQFLSEKDRQWQAYKEQVYEIRRIRQDIQRTKQQAAWVEQTTTSRDPTVRRYAKKVARKALSREKKLERFFSSEERVEKPKQGWQMKLDFGEKPGEKSGSQHLGQNAFYMHDLDIGYTGYPALLENLNLRVQANQRIALTGPNGCGKTTLLRTVAGYIPPKTGSVSLGASVKLGYMSQEQEYLDPNKNAIDTLRKIAPLNETDARSFLHYFLFSGDDVFSPLSQLSYGERARLMLATLVADGCNLLLLDEPINHLDIPSRERFEAALLQFEGTVLAVVHDRYFINRFATDLWIVAEKGLRWTVLR